MVFAPHPDDETLACGGTIGQKRRANAVVTVVFMTDGRTSHAHQMPVEELVQLRRHEASAACERLGVAPKDVVFLDFPDGDLERHQAQAVNRVCRILSERRPIEVYVPYKDDPQVDHVSTHDIVMRALTAHPEAVTVFAYPVWYWNHWPWTHLIRPGRRETLNALRHTLAAWFGLRMLRLFPHVVDVDDTLVDKREALAAHRTQMERMRAGTAWPVLADVSDGDFLDCFLQPFELFQRHELRAGRAYASAEVVPTEMTREV